MTGPLDVEAEAAARALSRRIFRDMLATQESFAAYLGYKLGLYDVLRDHGPLTVAELAQRAAVAPRYCREWLEQQAGSGLIASDDAGMDWAARRYRLPPGHERVLTASADPLSLVSTALLPLGGVARALPHLIEAYRTGSGVDADVFGDDWRDGHGGANRSMYTHQLAGWFRLHLPDVHRRLSAGRPRLVDIGCGAGWASIALAAAYPLVRITAVDTDARSVAQARDRVAEAGLADRISCLVADVATMDSPAGYDVVCVFDAMHELARPVEALKVCRGLCLPGGTVLVLDAQVADGFTAPGEEIERFQYATSVLHCLPAALVGEGAVGTGTVMRGPTMREYAHAAGFADVRSIDLNDRFHRIYQLAG